MFPGCFGVTTLRPIKEGAKLDQMRAIRFRSPKEPCDILGANNLKHDLRRSTSTVSEKAPAYMHWCKCRGIDSLVDMPAYTSGDLGVIVDARACVCGGASNAAVV
jgi:hypothetical protein